MTPLLTRIREKVIASVPEIWTGCYHDMHHSNCTNCTNPYRPIRLADILLAMQGKDNGAIGLDMNGYFLDCDDDMNNVIVSEQCWDLRADDLEKQSPECWEFIGEILGV